MLLQSRNAVCQDISAGCCKPQPPPPSLPDTQALSCLDPPVIHLRQDPASLPRKCPAILRNWIFTLRSLFSTGETIGSEGLFLCDICSSPWEWGCTWTVATSLAFYCGFSQSLWSRVRNASDSLLSSQSFHNDVLSIDSC